MIIKMLITFDYNPDTNEYKPISKEIVEDTKKVTKVKSTVKEESTKPEIILEENKYTLNQAAAALLGVKWEDRISIKYKKVESILVPIIGKDEAFGCKGGNKLTKSLTVSCRGNAHERLERYGDKFTLKETEDDDLFILVGNAEVPQNIESDEIQVPESEPDIDLDLDSDIELDENTFEITDETFKL